jgi:hypothetical protein
MNVCRNMAADPKYRAVFEPEGGETAKRKGKVSPQS